jgi:hypothetical protein
MQAGTDGTALSHPARTVAIVDTVERVMEERASRG